MIKFKKIYATGAAALVILLLFSYIESEYGSLYYSTKIFRAAKVYDGEWELKKSTSVRTYNDDGSFNVKTLQGFDMKSIPKDTKFSDFNDKWKKVSQLPDASDFYGEFANESGNACREWSDVVRNKRPYDVNGFLKNQYIWQCGGWAGYSVVTNYIPTEKEKKDLITYDRFSFLGGWVTPIYLICFFLIIPSIWCGAWALIGQAYRLAIKAMKN